jgi:hypothetical protein
VSRRAQKVLRGRFAAPRGFVAAGAHHIAARFPEGIFPVLQRCPAAFQPIRQSLLQQGVFSFKIHTGGCNHCDFNVFFNPVFSKSHCSFNLFEILYGYPGLGGLFLFGINSKYGV